jgi:DNA modification methylase
MAPMTRARASTAVPDDLVVVIVAGSNRMGCREPPSHPFPVRRAREVDIPLRCIAAGCPPDGVVLDPFSGAATTGLAARQLGRTYIGIDLNLAFHDIGLRRLGLLPKQPRRAA